MPETSRSPTTADTDLRLCKSFGLTDGYRLRAQAAYDTEVAREKLSAELQSIRTWRDIAARSKLLQQLLQRLGEQGGPRA